MAKFCKQCTNSKLIFVRWVMFNYGRIPWAGFLLPREKKQALALEVAMAAYLEKENADYNE